MLSKLMSAIGGPKVVETDPNATFSENARRSQALDPAAARELQLIAVYKLPMLTGAAVEDGDSLTIFGRAIARNGLHASMKFFVNGLPFEDVAYPVHEDDHRFSEVGGVTGFRATTRTHYTEITQHPYWRIDAARLGVYLPYAWRQAWWFANPRHQTFPMPSSPNMLRVVGDDDASRFLMGGSTIKHKLTALLQELGFTWKDFPKVLDWGCGCGRITRHLLAEPGIEVYGADIDEDNVAWCAANLAPGKFSVVAPAPPMAYADGMFDAVIGGSVMTHLTEDMQFAWLEELQRICRPGALVFLSIQGAAQFAHMGVAPTLYRLIQERGYVDRGRDPALDGFIADPSVYRSAWHSHRYVVDQWSRFFDVVTIEEGVAALQDLVVLRRR